MAYDNFFDLPVAPAIPEVNVVESDQEIILDWGENNAKVQETESQNAKGYQFQGYNIYQLPSASADVTQGKRIATFDINDGIGKIFDDVFDVNTGSVVNLPVQFGNDTGIKRFLTVNSDALKGGVPLVNGIRYYFAVTAYNYNPNVPVSTALENPLRIITVVPHSTNPGLGLEDFGEKSNIQHAGTADATVDVTVVNPTQITGHEYEVFFDKQHFYLDADGTWKKTNFPDSVGKKLAKVGDVSPSTLNAVATYATTAGTIDLNFILDLISPTDSWVDGITLTFPAGVTINSAPPFEAGGGTVTPEVNGNQIIFGLVNGDTTQNGVFHGGESFSVNVSGATPPLNIDYIIYDDGYPDPANPMNATGIASVNEIGHQFVTQNQWNVRDVTTGQVVVEDQTVYGGIDVYAGVPGPGGSSGPLGANAGSDADPTFDGLKVSVNGSFAAPTTIDHLTLNGAPYPVGNGGRTPYDLTDFTIFGNTTGTSNEAQGYGALSVDALQQDYEFRWTGELDSTTINGHLVYITKEGTGSIATFYGARQYDWSLHPLNPTGTQARFTARIPFEVWNIDQGIQVNYQFYDRGQADPAADGFKVWNTDARMYAEIINTPYAETVVPDADPNATWNDVWYASHYTTGDVIGLFYGNPLQTGIDKFTFNTSAPAYSADQAKEDVKKLNVFPNPYYGVNSEELNKYNRFVTFNHLPTKAKIRIFNLAGVLVKTIDKDDTGQFMRWDLANETGLPVASGLYLAYIEMPDIGTTKILKLAIIQEQQILDRF
ncbi:MAG: T9SS type A sorting domain-containing protein [Ignavibacteriaceae bacterium]